MRVDNVTFVESEIRKMTKKRFIELHSCYWPQMEDGDRKKKLADIYDRIVKSREDKI